MEVIFIYKTEYKGKVYLVPQCKDYKDKSQASDKFNRSVKCILCENGEKTFDSEPQMSNRVGEVRNIGRLYGREYCLCILGKSNENARPGKPASIFALSCTRDAAQTQFENCHYPAIW